MPTKKRTDMWDPIKGLVICKGHSTCPSRHGCRHAKRHKWIRFRPGKQSISCCYNSPETFRNPCNCSHKTKTELMVEAY